LGGIAWWREPVSLYGMAIGVDVEVDWVSDTLASITEWKKKRSEL
jgi:hypothetical protein